MIKNRRGLSTVVGAVFFIIAASSIMGYVSYSMNVLDKYNQSVLVKNQQDLDRSNEQFRISKVTTDNNKFNITIQNTGILPINVTRLWIQNTTGVDSVYKFDISAPVFPGESATKIGQNLPIYHVPTQGYTLRAITERGSVEEVSMNSAALAPLYMQLSALPESVPSGFTTTLLLSVTNNMSNNKILLNLEPNTITVTGSGSPTWSEISGPDPASFQSLGYGDTAYFKWVYQLDGDDGDQVTFTASLKNGILSNTASTTATITEVAFASQSDTSIQSKGLTTLSTADDVLVLHMESNADSLSPAYQLKPVRAEGAGTTIQLDTTSATWFTQNDTTSINIPAGTWRSYLRYLSAPLPDRLMTGTGSDMIFHFDNQTGNLHSSNTTAATTTWDLTSTGTTCTGAKAPSWQVNNGVNGTSAFYFDGSNDCLESISAVTTVCPSSNPNLICAEPDSTAMWIKTQDAISSSNKLTIVQWLEISSGVDEYYDISIGDGTAPNAGKLVFKFNTDSSTTRETKCVSAASVGDQKWHHIVAVRGKNLDSNNVDDCTLYVDGTSITTNAQSYSTDHEVDITTSGPTVKWYVGAGDQGTTEFFKGWIDDIIHFNRKGLTASEVLDLSKTSYGSNAHKVNFMINKMDKDGVFSNNIRSVYNYQMNFLDPIATYNSPTAVDWKAFNFTTAGVPAKSFTNERLKFNMSFVSRTNGELNLKLRIDDAAVSSGLGNTFLQIPMPDEPFPGYYTYANAAPGTININNESPRGTWITYKSKVIFDDLTGTSSYGGFITTVNSKTLSATADSPFFAPGQTYAAAFQQPRSIPGDATSTLIPTGKYRMYIYLDGYDENGNVYLATSYIGVVRVT